MVSEKIKKVQTLAQLSAKCGGNTLKARTLNAFGEPFLTLKFKLKSFAGLDGLRVFFRPLFVLISHFQSSFYRLFNALKH